MEFLIIRKYLQIIKPPNIVKDVSQLHGKCELGFSYTELQGNVLSSTNRISLMYRAIEPAWGHTSTIFNQGSKLRCQPYWHKFQLGHN